MDLGKKSFFNVKMLLLVLSLGIRIVILALDGVDKYFINKYDFVLAYFTWQLLAVIFDVVISILLYVWMKHLLGRSIPAILIALLYSIWPFMDYFIEGATPARAGFILLLCIILGVLTTIYTRLAYFIAPFLMAGIAYLAPQIAVGGLFGFLSLIYHGRNLPNGHRLGSYYMGIALLMWSIYGIFATKDINFIFSVQSIFVALIIVFAQFYFIKIKGLGRLATISTLVFGSLFYALTSDFEAAKYICLILVAPSLTIFIERQVEKMGYTHQ